MPITVCSSFLIRCTEHSRLPEWLATLATHLGLADVIRFTSTSWRFLVIWDWFQIEWIRDKVVSSDHAYVINAGVGKCGSASSLGDISIILVSLRWRLLDVWKADLLEYYAAYVRRLLSDDLTETEVFANYLICLSWPWVLRSVTWDCDSPVIKTRQLIGSCSHRCLRSVLAGFWLMLSANKLLIYGLLHVGTEHSQVIDDVLDYLWILRRACESKNVGEIEVISLE